MRIVLWVPSTSFMVMPPLGDIPLDLPIKSRQDGKKGTFFPRMPEKAGKKLPQDLRKNLASQPQLNNAGREDGPAKPTDARKLLAREHQKRLPQTAQECRKWRILLA